MSLMMLSWLRSLVGEVVMLGVELPLLVSASSSL